MINRFNIIPIKLSIAFFFPHRIRTKIFTICMETQDIWNNPSNLEKEEWSWRNQAPSLQIILQSYSNQDSMVLAQKQKYRSMEQDRKEAQR